MLTYFEPIHDFTSIYFMFINNMKKATAFSQSEGLVRVRLLDYILNENYTPTVCVDVIIV